MSLNAYQKACCFSFFAVVIYWIALFASGLHSGIYNNLFRFFYGLLPLTGGMLAMIGYQRWGGLSTILGKAILLCGFGLFLSGAGQMVWVYHNIFLGIQTPYPSIADLFYLPSVIFFTLGVLYLSKTTGARFGLKAEYGKVYAVFAPLAALFITYNVIVLIGNGGELVEKGSDALKTILDIAYPLGDAICLSVVAVVAGLSFKYLGGIYKYDVIFMLAGLGALFIANSVFSYTTTIGSYYNGSIGDLLSAVAAFLLTCGILGFNKIKRSEAAPAD